MLEISKPYFHTMQRTASLPEKTNLPKVQVTFLLQLQLVSVLTVHDWVHPRTVSEHVTLPINVPSWVCHGLLLPTNWKYGILEICP